MVQEVLAGYATNRILSTETRNDSYPLSAAQRRVWLAQRQDPAQPAYNIGEYIEVCGPIDPALFERALRQVVAETEALRIQILERADGPCQVVGAASEWSLTVIDVSAESDAQTAAVLWMKRDLARPMEPTHDLVFAYALFKISVDRFFWYARYHHIALDRFGMSLVTQRVAEVYTALANGQTTRWSSFGPLNLLLDDEAAYRASERYNSDRQFWSGCLPDRSEPLSS